MNKKYVAVVGNLLGYSHVIAGLLKNHGINSISIDNTRDIPFEGYTIDEIHLNMDSIKQLIKNASLTISLGPSIIYHLGLLNCIKEFVIKRKRIAFITQGSDITEYINEKSFYAALYRYLLRKSSFNLFSPYTHSLKNLLKHNIFNMFWSKHPHKLPKKQKNMLFGTKQKLLFFHCSNLDWGANDNKPGRNSTKGNDRFLNAYKRVIKKGIKAHCYILYRGPDRDLARKFIIKNNLENHFTWFSDMDQKTLTDFMCKSDMIIDQFDVGGLGGIACEAMAQAKPVMIHIDKNCWHLAYDEEPPVINCHTEDEIYEAILEWSDRKKLQDLGKRAEVWVRKYHDVQTADFSEFILRVCLAAGLEWPRKDLAKQNL